MVLLLKELKTANIYHYNVNTVFSIKYYIFLKLKNSEEEVENNKSFKNLPC